MDTVFASELVELHSYLGSACRLLESSFSSLDHPANDVTPFLVMIQERMSPIVDGLHSGELIIVRGGLE